MLSTFSFFIFSIYLFLFVHNIQVFVFALHQIFLSDNALQRLVVALEQAQALTDAIADLRAGMPHAPGDTTPRWADALTALITGWRTGPP